MYIFFGNLGCGHCKKAKPEFQAAAEYFKDDPKVDYLSYSFSLETNEFL